MKPRDISKAKDPDLRSSLAAIRRLVAETRRTAIETGKIIARETIAAPLDRLRSGPRE